VIDTRLAVVSLGSRGVTDLDSFEGQLKITIIYPIILIDFKNEYLG